VDVVLVDGREGPRGVFLEKDLALGDVRRFSPPRFSDLPFDMSLPEPDLRPGRDEPLFSESLLRLGIGLLGF